MVKINKIHNNGTTEAAKINTKQKSILHTIKIQKYCVFYAGYTTQTYKMLSAIFFYGFQLTMGRKGCRFIYMDFVY